MPSASLRFSTEILRRLGEELNPSFERGVLELVKNSYDADARKCTVTIEGGAELGGTLSISDNGDGMGVSGIRSGWLVLGSSRKDKTRTRLGRVPAGSKGLGRLAALRMGTCAELSTRPRNGKMDHRVTIDWNDFEGAGTVDQVVLDIKSRRKTKGTGQGTDIKIKGLRSALTPKTVRRLARELVLLNHPFSRGRSSFKVELVAEEFSEATKLVQESYFDQADYHLRATLRSGGIASATVTDWRGNVLFEASHEDIAAKRPAQAKYRCPRATFDLWTFVLNRQSFATRSATIGEVKTWLGQFGGVHLFEDGLRVAPYGDPGNDWLQLNLARVKNPEERPSTNNSIGRVALHKGADLLVQKTDRAGYIETPTFAELRAFAIDALNWMASRRLEEAEKRRRKAKKTRASKKEKAREKLRKALAKSPETEREQGEQAANEFEKAHEAELNQLRKENQLYRTLGTIGIAAATFAHESTGAQLKAIRSSVSTIKRRCKRSLGEQEYDDQLSKPFDRIDRSTKSLLALGNSTLNFLAHEKRRIGRVDLHDVIRTTVDNYTGFLKNANITVDQRLANSNPYLRGTEAALEAVIANLLSNSITAFEGETKKRRTITITSASDGENFSLEYSDNGPGIEGISVRRIWNPGETTRTDGTGLGLTIVRDSIDDLGGTVAAVAHGPLGGASFTIELPILGH